MEIPFLQTYISLFSASDINNADKNKELTGHICRRYDAWELTRNPFVYPKQERGCNKRFWIYMKPKGRMTWYSQQSGPQEWLCNFLNRRLRRPPPSDNISSKCYLHFPAGLYDRSQSLPVSLYLNFHRSSPTLLLDIWYLVQYYCAVEYSSLLWFIAYIP